MAETKKTLDNMSMFIRLYLLNFFLRQNLHLGDTNCSVIPSVVFLFVSFDCIYYLLFT